MLFMIFATGGWRNAARVALSTIAFLALALLLAPYVMAATDVAPQPPGEIITGANVWLVLIGLASPLVTYLLNHFAPWASEQAKGLVQAGVAAVAALVYQMVSSGNFGWNGQTLVAVLTTLGAALAAHIGYKQAGFNTFLGAGRNANGQPPVQKTLV